MACLTLEGEPGIGKTRLLLTIQDMARVQGFLASGVTADEEIRGPLLLARSIFASPGLEVVEGKPAENAIRRVVEAIGSSDEPGLASVTPDRMLLRVFDLAATAFREIAAQRPTAIFIDDLQWADEDSLRMLRYVVRAVASSPILLVAGVRPAEIAFVMEAVTLLADLERMGLLRRIKLARFNQVESAEFLQQVLAAKINSSTAAVMHDQAEGVPYILAEQAHAYRDAGLIQQIDGVWTLARNAERLQPAGVRTLIQRRAASLPEATRSSLSEAAILGRSFSLRDLADLKMKLGEQKQDGHTLAELLAPAVSRGLLIQQTESSPADYTFSHEQIREFVTSSLPPPRRRAVHAAIVDMLNSGGDPPPASLPLLARHALAAGQAELCARFATEGARYALQAHAPEEALRLVDLAQPIASSPSDRVALLRLRDDALDALRRPAQRLEGLAELSALAGALADPHLEREVMLRRAAAHRLSQEQDRAAELARQVRELAAESGDAQTELAACLELGQDLLRTEIGEGYTQPPSESDLDGADEAYGRAAAIAEELGDEVRLAAAIRELGIIAASRVRAWFIASVQAGEHVEILQRVAAGEGLEDILPTLPIAPLATEADSRFRRALEIYERLGDRQGVMATIIAMVYLSWGPEIHLPGSAKRIEEIRRLSIRRYSLTKGSERAREDAQMLFGTHVYALAKVFPDVALAKGEEAYAAARALGEPSIEFAAAGGMAISHAALGAIEEAERWLGLAAAVASTAPTPSRARRLEFWRGMVCAVAGDAVGMRQHLQKAVQFATDQAQPAARCEALAELALRSARLGAERHDDDLVALAERSAGEANDLIRLLPGHSRWGAQAEAALAGVALARGALDAAAAHGRAALVALDETMSEDMSLDVVLPAADAILRGGSDDDAKAVLERLRLALALVAQRIVDEDVRVRWFQGPIGRELTRLAGPLEVASLPSDSHSAAPLSKAEQDLLRLLTEGRTNSEIAEELGTREDFVARSLAELYVTIGASSRSDAMAVALMGKLV